LCLASVNLYYPSEERVGGEAFIIGVGGGVQTQKAEMTMIVGKTFRQVLPILRRVERGAEKNGGAA